MIARGRRPLAPVVALAALLSAGAAAAAAPAPQPPPKVILVRPPAAPAAVSEALVRLRGELVAAGFDAQVVEQALGVDVRASLEKLSPPRTERPRPWWPWWPAPSPGAPSCGSSIA